MTPSDQAMSYLVNAIVVLIIRLDQEGLNDMAANFRLLLKESGVILSEGDRGIGWEVKGSTLTGAVTHK